MLRPHRTHIHFATAAALLRPACSVALVLELPAALAAGHAFWRSLNGVLLPEGPLPTAFVAARPAAEVPWPHAAEVPRQPSRAAQLSAKAQVAAVTTVAGAAVSSGGSTRGSSGLS